MYFLRFLKLKNLSAKSELNNSFFNCFSFIASPSFSRSYTRKFNFFNNSKTNKFTSLTSASFFSEEDKNGKYGNVGEEKNKFLSFLMYNLFTGFFISFFLKKKNLYCYFNEGAMEEVELGKAEGFEEGKMYNVKVYGDKSSVLVFKTEGKWYCTGALCSHYSAPLVKGVLTKDHVTCPWHDAEFDIKTGMPVNGPALNPIPTYEINEKNGILFAKLPKEIRNFLEPCPSKAKLPNTENQIFAIVGGGSAAITAAQTLREKGFNGRIILISKEKYLPYDRVVLSKNLSATIEKIKLRDENFFKKFSIEVLLDSEVEKLNTNNNEIIIKNGNKIFYNKVLIASGSEARHLDIPGNKLKNIFVLRNFEDAQRINESAKKGVKFVVVGSSFIGMEIASTLAKSGASVTIISQDSVPFERILGIKVGNVFKQLLKENNIKFFANKDVKEFIGNAKGAVCGVRLHDGDVIQADNVVLGVGTCLNTNFIEGISLNKNDKAVIVDPFMKSIDKDNVFAAGDIAQFPYVQSGEMTRIEHWCVAQQQGRIAAMNMCNESHHPYHSIPFFWTMLLKNSLRFAGHFKSFDEVIFEGDLSNYKFVAYYVKNNKIVGVATMNNDPIAVAVCEAMRLNKMPFPSEITLGIANSAKILKSVEESTFAKPKEK